MTAWTWTWFIKVRYEILPGPAGLVFIMTIEKYTFMYLILIHNLHQLLDYCNKNTISKILHASTTKAKW